MHRTLLIFQTSILRRRRVISSMFTRSRRRRKGKKEKIMLKYHDHDDPLTVAATIHKQQRHQPQTPSPMSPALPDSPAGVSERSPVQRRTWRNCSTSRGLRCCTHHPSLPQERPPPGNLFSVLWARRLLSLWMESRLRPELASEVRLCPPAQSSHTRVRLVQEFV